MVDNHLVGRFCLYRDPDPIHVDLYSPLVLLPGSVVVVVVDRPLHLLLFSFHAVFAPIPLALAWHQEALAVVVLFHLERLGAGVDEA